ncbi:MAG: hypothetical protein IPJ77_12200 [Planctomycetes bacterium]|nr:hypothetical protein [Planctomycetota bacterium]
MSSKSDSTVLVPHDPSGFCLSSRNLTDFCTLESESSVVVPAVIAD